MFSEEYQKKIKNAKLKIESAIGTFQIKYSALPWQDMFLTGGAIASILQGEKPNDWDFYSKNSFTSVRVGDIVISRYMDSVKGVPEKYQSFIGENGKVITAKAITMEDTAQFITCMSGLPNEIKKTFDYVHCTPHYDIQEGNLYISEKQLDAILNKKLMVNNYGALKTWRQDKFERRGYKTV